jgi:endonuclease-3 related protein
VGGIYFPPHEDCYEIIAGAILTQNTSWKNASKALKALREKGLLDPEKIVKLKPYELAKVIRSSGYYNQKAERLLAITELFLKTKGEGRSPEREELLSVKGVGPETADSILLYAYHKPVFVVDAYTRRTFVRIGLLKGELSYEEIQDVFMKNLPRDEKLYNEFHALIVKHGKDVCRKIPLCSKCILLQKKLCQFKSE